MPVPLVRIFDVADAGPHVRQAGELLAGGGLVVLPTETVYGAAGRVDVPAGRDKLAAFRGGGAGGGSAFTVHVARREQADEYLGDVSDLGRRLMRKLWPGPVGLTFPVPADRRRAVAARLNVDESALYDAVGQITLRCPDDPLAIDVIDAADGPVALAAINGPGGPARRADGLADDLDGKVDLIFDAGPTRYAKPSTLVRVDGDRYEIVRAGVYDERIIEKMLRTTILFVCSGNTCRSPMAEAIARSVLAKQLGTSEAELESKGVTVLSAGSFAMPGARAAAPAIEAVRNLGGDLSQHRSRPLTIELIHQADRVYAMSRAHAAAAAALVPSAADKIQTLDPAGDVEDPIGGDLPLYTKLAGELRQLIERRLTEQPVR